MPSFAYPLPAARPLVKDVSVMNSRPERAETTRQLQGQQLYSYAHDLRFGPNDATEWNNIPAPSVGGCSFQNWVNNSADYVSFGLTLCRFYAPPHEAYATKLKVRIYCLRENTSVIGFVDFFSARNGSKLKRAIIDGAAGGANAILTVDVDVPLTGEDSVEARLIYNAGAASKCWVLGISAYWEPLDGINADVTIDSAWVSLLQSWSQNGRPDDAFVLKWLQRKMAQLLGHRPRQVLAKWWGADNDSAVVKTWFDTTVATRDRTVGLYRIYVGEHPPSAEIRFLAKVSGSGTFNIKTYVGGVLKATTLVSSTTYAWVTANITGLTKAAVNEVRIDSSIAVTSGSCTLKLASVSMWENEPAAADLALPGGDTIPAAFTPEDTRLVRSRSNVAADFDPAGRRTGRAGLVAGLIYLAARRVRHLVSDCRYTDIDTVYGGSDLIVGDATVQAVYKFRTGPDTKGIRAALAWQQVKWTGGYNGSNDLPLKATFTVVAATGISVPWWTSPEIAGPYVRSADIDVSASRNTEYEIRLSFPIADATFYGQGRFIGASFREAPLTDGDLVGM